MTLAFADAGSGLARLRGFIRDFAELGGTPDRRHEELLRDLVSNDDWLPDAYAQPDPDRYRQYLLHCDSRERFSVVSFVWGPGQRTPIHDHRTWGLVGVLRGAEVVRNYGWSGDGALIRTGPAHRLEPGDVEAFGPESGDIHSVSNACDDRVSISIHVYGDNIGAVQRATYDSDGRPKRFISGYANDSLPNLWDLSSR